MDSLATDTTEAPLPPGVTKPAAEDRGATKAAKTGRQLGPGIFLAGASLIVILYAATFGLGSNGEEVVKEEPTSAAMVDMGSLDPRDPAATAVLAAEGDGAGSTVDPEAIGPDGEPLTKEQVAARDDLARMREERIAAREAERERLIAEARARKEARERAPVMVMAAAQGGRAAPAAQRGDRRPPSADTAATAPAPAGPVASELQGSDIVRVSASTLPNRGFTIEAGTQIPCTLQTALDSTLSGLVSCVIPYDVRSATGQVILLEKGTRILGEYQGGIQQGQSRIFIIWNRAVSPKGVTVNLASPSADTLGRSGQAGEVENFFFKRFGGALLLSLIGDGSQALANSISGVEQTFNAPNQAAAEALRNDIRIRPVLRAPQGSSAVIIASRDLDFSNVYSLRLKR